MEFNLADLLESITDTLPDREALVCGSSRYTYAKLEARANRLAHHLRQAGLTAGEHVGLQLHNGVEYVEALLACLKLRAVPVNVNYRYVERELAYLYDDADLAMLLFDAELAPRVAAATPDAPKLRHLMAVGTPGDEPAPLDAARYEDALAAQPARREFPARSPDDHYIIYTGGTTGMPKGVVWRQEDLFFAGMGGGEPMGEPVSRPEEIAERAAGRGPLVMFPVAPLMHGAAQLATFIGFLQGQKVVLVRRFDAAQVWEVVAREGANAISIVGDAMARPMVDALRGQDAGTDMSSVLSLSSAGALLSASVRDELQELLPNALILDNFGASETGFNGTGTLDADGKPRVTVNDRTAVLGESLRPLPPGSGEVGRLAQRRHVPLGYYKDTEKTASTFVTVDGERWVLLGDMARVEADGTVSFLGRGSVCINSGGEKIYPEEVESVLKGHPAVFDALVTGVEDPTYGERVAAVVQLRADVARPTEQELDTHCRAGLASYKVPRSVIFVDEVQRSPSGKPDYRWARRVAEVPAP